MGKCWKCETEFALGENETRCDSCGEIVGYSCHECKEPFIVEKENKNKLKECKACGFFVCPNCGVCGDSCRKNDWATRIKQIVPTIIKEELTELLNYIEEIKLSKEQKNCPFGIPISYGKGSTDKGSGRIKSILAKTEGFRVRNNLDQEKFKERLEEIKDMDFDETFTISDKREDGAYGQEYRDVCNLSVCLGELEVFWKLNKKGEKYALFKRVDGNHCVHLNTEDLVITKCPKCNTKYSREQERCRKDECVYKKGEEKGQARKLIQKLSNKDVCQLRRGEFTKRGENEEEEIET